MKKYTAREAAALQNVKYHALVKQLERDLLKEKSQLKYPGAYKKRLGTILI
jgi:hypothetical protein